MESLGLGTLSKTYGITGLKGQELLAMHGSVGENNPTLTERSVEVEVINPEDGEGAL